MTERILRVTKEVIEHPFTTEPKTFRKPNKTSISLEKAKLFMEHLWNKGLKECSYPTLEFEFVMCFGTNEPRVLTKYLGRPKMILHYGGSSVVRLSRQSGQVAQFEYSNRRTVKPIKGLLEILGFVTQEVNGRFILNHSRLGYYSEQASIDNLCVCNDLEAVESEGQSVETSGERKEEEDIDSAHKSSLDFLHTGGLTVEG